MMFSGLDLKLCMNWEKGILNNINFVIRKTLNGIKINTIYLATSFNGLWLLIKYMPNISFLFSGNLIVGQRYVESAIEKKTKKKIKIYFFWNFINICLKPLCAFINKKTKRWNKIN